MRSNLQARRLEKQRGGRAPRADVCARHEVELEGRACAGVVAEQLHVLLPCKAAHSVRALM